jgi:superfamily I DNA/RNA helicase
LESDRVIILLPNKLPLCWKGQKEWQYQQEMNLKYVALTRAKKELVFVNLDITDLLKVEFKR